MRSTRLTIKSEPMVARVLPGLTALGLMLMGVGTASANGKDCVEAAGLSCTYDIKEVQVEKAPNFIKFQSRISQAKLPVGDVVFDTIYVLVKYGETPKGEEMFSNVRVRDSVLNLEIGRSMNNPSLEEVLREYSALTFQICLGNKENCLKPISLSSVPFAIKSSYAREAEQANAANTAVQCHFAHLVTADRDMLGPNKQIGKGFYDFHTPNPGEVRELVNLYDTQMSMQLPENSEFFKGGYMQWTQVDEQVPTNLHICAAGVNSDYEVKRLDQLVLHADVTETYGQLAVHGPKNLNTPRESIKDKALTVTGSGLDLYGRSDIYDDLHIGKGRADGSREMRIHSGHDLHDDGIAYFHNHVDIGDDVGETEIWDGAESTVCDINSHLNVDGTSFFDNYAYFDKHVTMGDAEKTDMQTTTINHSLLTNGTATFTNSVYIGEGNFPAQCVIEHSLDVKNDAEFYGPVDIGVEKTAELLNIRHRLHSYNVADFDDVTNLNKVTNLNDTVNVGSAGSSKTMHVHHKTEQYGNVTMHGNLEVGSAGSANNGTVTIHKETRFVDKGRITGNLNIGDQGSTNSFTVWNKAYFPNGIDGDIKIGEPGRTDSEVRDLYIYNDVYFRGAVVLDSESGKVFEGAASDLECANAGQGDTVDPKTGQSNDGCVSANDLQTHDDYTFYGGFSIQNSTGLQVVAEQSTTSIWGHSLEGIGVYGDSISNNGVRGSSESASGVAGESVNESGVYGQTRYGIDSPYSSVEIAGVRGYAFDDAVGVSGKSEKYHGVYGETSAGVDSQTMYVNIAGVHGYGEFAVGVYGRSNDSFGVRGESSNYYGIYGTTSAQSVGYAGIYGKASNAVGVKGESSKYYGVQGFTSAGTAQNPSNTYAAVYGKADNAVGVYGKSTNGLGGQFESGAKRGAINLKPIAGHPSDAQPGDVWISGKKFCWAQEEEEWTEGSWEEGEPRPVQRPSYTCLSWEGWYNTSGMSEGSDGPTSYFNTWDVKVYLKVYDKSGTELKSAQLK